MGILRYRGRILAVLAVIALFVLAIRHTARSREALREAQEYEMPMRCTACGATYTNRAAELNALIEGGQSNIPPDEESPAGYRKFRCAACGKIEAMWDNP